jgi:hypothetical protein
MALHGLDELVVNACVDGHCSGLSAPAPDSSSQGLGCLFIPVRDGDELDIAGLREVLDSSAADIPCSAKYNNPHDPTVPQLSGERQRGASCMLAGQRHHDCQSNA